MTNTQTRILTAVVVVPVLLGLIFMGGIAWGLLVATVAGIGAYEYYEMARKCGYNPQTAVGVVACFGFCLMLSMHRPNIALGLLALGVFVALALDLARNEPGGSIGNIGASLTGMIYIGGLLSHAVLVRSYLGSNELGVLFIIIALATSMLCDSGAYFTGRAYGRRKLIPNISPGKTIEGTVGGFLFGIATVLLIKAVAGVFMTVPLGWLGAVLLGTLICTGGIIGDLVESALKRDAGVKDSGKVFPGHGGVMDRLDSLLWSIPLTYYFARWMVK